MPVDGSRARDYIGNMAVPSVSLPAELQQWVAARADAEGYADASDYLQELILRERDVYEGRVRRLQAMLDQGFASGMLDEEPEDILEQIIAELPARDG